MTTSSENESGSPPLHVEKCSLVLVDVAGTTTSIDFVKDTLYPFVVERVETFLGAKWDEDSVKECLKQIQEKDQDLDVAKAVDIVKKLTKEDSPNQGLKTLQGLIYKEGYEKGDLKAHVFEDVADAFETWAKSRQIAVYSTGSVDSQKLLFKHTTSGDLSAHISNYFDQTAAGKKTEAESYKKIAEETKIPPEEIVFITDDVKEATAAKAGGLHAVLIKRKGNQELTEEVSKEFLTINTFNELALDKTSKRKIEEGPANTEAPPSKVPKTDSEKTEATEKPEEKEESMDVDPEKAETVTKETENLVKNEPEKTETEKDKKTETTDAEMKEVEKEKTETPAKTVVEVTTEEIKPTAEEPKPTVEEKEEKVTEEPKKELEKPKEEVKTTAVEEPKAEEIEKKTEETPSKESSIEKVEAQPAKEKETDLATEPEPEKAEKAETKPEEVKVEDKPKEESLKNGEEGETSKPKTEEKENKSVLANGVENGNKDESEVDNTTEEKSETSEITNTETVDNKDDDNEVKVKKLEESAESKTVSVEV